MRKNFLSGASFPLRHIGGGGFVKADARGEGLVGHETEDPWFSFCGSGRCRAARLVSSTLCSRCRARLVGASCTTRAVNAPRRSYAFAVLPGIENTFGACPMKIKGNRAEPPEAARGMKPFDKGRRRS